ncbi:type II toxin-antitoxin system RelE/ParE family toxin [Antarcticibacterium sp. 1MA-6-2]|uniref:type II toxin-antitoxin system RelE/ParE family toxin n=1 Tax=Antarcticibacterium sp. 1MA-6-2 TaxID=2908210 RepID=UPI001F3E51C6|nr:type II toxin-antitoxin system RelE/ParE family toxin [Antarcticibacterium sp. 1MA-6-2]UJH89914.1 type II toxin-antitoxin system RelE/ParE family toxin [Antarcticibacterium sp. 1MA-6-2]
MEMKIVWTNFAKNELRKIFLYYNEAAGTSLARKLVNKIIQNTLVLQSQPGIGQVEKLLLISERNFHYLVVSNYKIIYVINQTKDQVEILDIFDTRQNPDKLERNY